MTCAKLPLYMSEIILLGERKPVALLGDMK